MAAALWTGLLVASPVAGQPQLGPDARGSGVHVGGEARIRYDHLGSQFRGGAAGDGDLLLFRTLLLAEAGVGAARIGLELQDSRAYLANPAMPLGSSLVDPLDLLQAYLELPLLEGEHGRGIRVRLGRQTVDIGSGRQIERPNFANVIRSYTGMHLTASLGDGHELHALALAPVERLPATRTGRAHNEIDFNDEEWERRIWALHYRRPALHSAIPGLAGEVYVHGLHEDDSGNAGDPVRRLVTPGLRLLREPHVGRWDVDMEAALRFGSRRSDTGDEESGAELDVFAQMLFATFGYTWDSPWRPRAAFQLYLASGDDDPTDGRYGRYERLFGSRRSDLNNTSTFGPLTPANLRAVGIRLQAAPSDVVDGRVSYFHASLASATDAWVVAGLRDPTGSSGRFLGHQLDTRVRYRPVPARLTLEVGASALVYGEFAREVAEGPDGGHAWYGYAQATVRF